MNRYLTSSKAYICPKCGSLFHHQLHRSLFMKALSVVKPVRHFYCAKCKKGRYVVLRKESEND